jgi:hypothetical protein
MMTTEHMSTMLAATLLALGAVAVILYQHSNATQSVISALGGVTTTPGASPADILGTPASLAGSPTATQSGTSQIPPIVPTQSGPGWTVS